MDMDSEWTMDLVAMDSEFFTQHLNLNNKLLVFPFIQDRVFPPVSPGFPWEVFSTIALADDTDF